MWVLAAGQYDSATKQALTGQNDWQNRWELWEWVGAEPYPVPYVSFPEGARKFYFAEPGQLDRMLADSIERAQAAHQENLPPVTVTPTDGMRVVAQGDFDSFAKAVPAIAELPAGTPVVLRVELQPWVPFGKLADLAGTELWAQKLVPAHIAVDDVYGSWTWVEIRGRVTGSPAVLIIAGIVAALVALGYAAWMVKEIKLSADIKEREKNVDDLLRELIDAGLTPEQAQAVIAGTRPAPPGVTLPDWVQPTVAGIGTGLVVVLGLAVFLALRK